METKEYSAKTVDEAITKACIDLGLSSDRLNVEVVNEGSTGFLGFGSKPALIRVSKKSEDDVRNAASPVKEAASTVQDEKSAAEDSEKEAESEFTAEPASAPSYGTQDSTAAASEKTESVEENFSSSSETEPAPAPEKMNGSHSGKKASADRKAAEKEREPVERTEEEIEALKASASKFLSEVFHAMDLPVDIKMNYEAEDDVLSITFEGDDMGILIGKRGQTLDSLQYLTSLVVNRTSNQFVRIKLDTENYRERRKETLENLANNIARKVKKTGHAVSLEPMNPYERRIIHSCLQSNRYVETYSEGSEPYRHVVISPKR